MGTRRMLNVAAAAAVAVAALARGPARGEEKAKKPAKHPVVIPVETVRLQQVMQGVAKADLWGDPKKWHGTLTKFAAGTQVGMHAHTNDTRIVVISGLILHGDAQGKVTHLGPGSFCYVPGGQRHTTACADGMDCLFYEELPGEFDLKMMEGDKAK